MLETVNSTYPGNNIEGWMSAAELAWLYETAKQMRSIVEVGSFKGRSTHALCSGCQGTVTAVDHFAPEHLGPIGDRILEEFTANMRAFPRLKVIRAWSVDAAQQFEDSSIDMVFIDAHHTYTPAWPGVIRAVDEQLGPVYVHDTIWFQPNDGVDRPGVPSTWGSWLGTKTTPKPKVGSTSMNCPKCNSENLHATGTESVRHVIRDGAVIHIIEDGVQCLDCDTVFNVERSAVSAPGASPTE